MGCFSRQLPLHGAAQACGRGFPSIVIGKRLELWYTTRGLWPSRSAACAAAKHTYRKYPALLFAQSAALLSRACHALRSGARIRLRHQTFPTPNLKALHGVAHSAVGTPHRTFAARRGITNTIPAQAKRSRVVCAVWCAMPACLWHAFYLLLRAGQDKSLRAPRNPATILGAAPAAAM